MATWKKSKGKCPRCDKHTEELLEKRWEGNREIKYVNAERCRYCHWVIRFAGGN